MIKKVHYYPEVIKLDKNFRETLKDWEVEYHKRLYTAPLLGYYVPWLSKVVFMALVPWEAQELIRKGTFGYYRGRLKGYTRIFKVKNCVYIPEVRTSEGYLLLTSIQANSLEDFIKQTQDVNLNIEDVL